MTIRLLFLSAYCAYRHQPDTNGKEKGEAKYTRSKASGGCSESRQNEWNNGRKDQVGNYSVFPEGEGIGQEGECVENEGNRNGFDT